MEIYSALPPSPGADAPRTAQEYLCYSHVMQPAADSIAGIHDRMPLLIPAGFAEEWLTSAAPAGQLIDAARGASQPLATAIIGTRQGAAAEPLF